MKFVSLVAEAFLLESKSCAMRASVTICTEIKVTPIPNFFDPIDEFVGNMMRCGVLRRDPNRRGWLTICEPPRRRPAPVQPPASPPAPAPVLPTLNTASVAVAPMSPTSALSDQTPDPFLGKSIWHEGLGIGVVMKKVVRCSPVYDVRFRDDISRRILLRSDHHDWALVDPSLSTPAAF